MRTCLWCEGIVADSDAETCGGCGRTLLPTDGVHFPRRRGEADAAHPMLGRQVAGKYRIQGVLGHGGMGTVFRARHEVSLAPVAIKILKPRFAGRSDYREAFLHEARKAGQVIDDHCARVFDVGSEDSGVFLAMELAEGETLADWLQRGRPTPATTVEILRQITRALQAVHDQGLVHRDLSSRNVMMSDRDGQPWIKVLDFGIAQGGAEGLGDLSPRGEAAAFANPGYAAPEHLAGAAVDARADLYSLGALAFEMLTGEPVVPHVGNTTRPGAKARAARERHSTPEELPRVRGVPTALRRLVGRLLAPDPEDRPASATEVLAVLDSILRPRGRALPLVAAVLAVLSTAFLAAALTVREDAFLTSRPGGALELSLRPASVVQHLRTESLESVALDCGGFDESELRIEVYREGRSLRGFGLRPELDAGLLVLAADGASGWRDVLDFLDAESEGGPLDVELSVPGRQPLGYARVRLDDRAPRLGLRLGGADAGLIRADTLLEIVAEDSGGWSPEGVQLVLVIQGVAGGPQAEDRVVRVTLPPAMLAAGFAGAADLLADVLGGVGDHGPLMLWLEARDRAGNAAQSPTIEGVGIDLACPRILSVSGAVGGTTLVHSGGGVDLSLELDGFEPGIVVDVVDPQRRRFDGLVVESAPGGGRVRLPGSPRPIEKDYADGLWQFVLMDRAGNRAPPRSQRLQFRRSTRNVTILPVAPTGAEVEGVRAAGRIGDQMLVIREGLSAEFDVQCGTPWVPQPPVVVQTGSGEPAEGVAVEVVSSSAGASRFRVRCGSPGLFELRLALREDVRGAGTPEPSVRSLRVLPRQLVVRLPETADARFLQQLTARLVVVRQDGSVRQGSGWQLDPPDARLFAVVPYSGVTSLRPLDVVRPSTATDGVLGSIPLQAGRFRIGIVAADLLGAPVRVEGGTGGLLEGEGDVQVHEVASFVHDDRAPSVAGAEVLLEFGVPARVTVRTPLPFQRGDEPRIALTLTQSACPLRRMRPGRNGGTELEFSVPYADLRDAAGLSQLAPRDFAQGLLRPNVRAQLVTPAGTSSLSFTVRTTRSVLEPVPLGELSTKAAGRPPIPEVLAQLTLEPVLPPDGAFGDPTAEDPSRQLYRPLPVLEVRRLDDYYLARDELTRRQYAALVSWLGAATVDDPAPLVHRGDPLGTLRLTADAMRPAAWTEQQWQEHLERGPERPVAGLSYFQAFAAARALGLLLVGDPDLVRLPLGVELELAARQVAQPETADRFVAAHAGWADQMGNPARWPATAEELREIGDVSESFTGLEFGVREWVEDLAFRGSAQDTRLTDWMRDPQRHLEEARRLARDGATGADDAPWLRLGVVRGLALGEVHGVLPVGSVNRTPGVHRVLNLRRDARDAIGPGVDARVARIGMRIAGGKAFLERVRQRWR